MVQQWPNLQLLKNLPSATVVMCDALILHMRRVNVVSPIFVVFHPPINLHGCIQSGNVPSQLPMQCIQGLGPGL